MGNKTKKKPVPEQSAIADVFDWLEMAVVSACAILLLFTFIARPARVDGPSMENTLHHGEMLLLSNIGFEPKYGDILVFQKINNSMHAEPIVKRVIATEGETVDIDFDTWTVTVTDANGNERVLDESAYRKLATDQRVTSDLQYPITVGENQLFVMGDNRNHSADSRSSQIGLVSRDEVIGRVLLRLFPLNKIRLF